MALDERSTNTTSHTWPIKKEQRFTFYVPRLSRLVPRLQFPYFGSFVVVVVVYPLAHGCSGPTGNTLERECWGDDSYQRLSLFGTRDSGVWVVVVVVRKWETPYFGSI